MILFVILGLFLALIFLSQFISFYVDWLWFKDVRFEKIFTVKLNAQAISALAGGLTGFIITYINLWYSIKSTAGRPVVTASFSQALPQLDLLRHFDRFKMVVPIVVGLMSALLLSSNWLTFLYYFNSAAAGHTDPIFGKDVSFYLFALPFHEIISSTLLMLLIISLIVSAVNYVLKGAVFFTQRGLIPERYASAHLSLTSSLGSMGASCPFMKNLSLLAAASSILLASNVFGRPQKARTASADALRRTSAWGASKSRMM